MESTYNTRLMVKGKDGNMFMPVCIKEYGDLGGEPSTIDASTMCDAVTVSIPGMQSLDALTFTANYSLENYARLKYLDDHKVHTVELWLGNQGNGESGIFRFDGMFSVWKTGAGVDEVSEISFSITPTSAPTLVQNVLAYATVEKEATSLKAVAKVYTGLDGGTPTFKYQWYVSATENGTFTKVTPSGTAETLSSPTNNSHYYVEIEADENIVGVAKSEVFKYTT